MNNKVEYATRLAFRDWLRSELRRLEFYTRRGDHYLIREFAKYCMEMNAPIDEASLGRYVRDEDPVLPTSERCRALAQVLGRQPLDVLVEAGYLQATDFVLPGEKTFPDLRDTDRIIPANLRAQFETATIPTNYVTPKSKKRAQEERKQAIGA